MSGTYPTTPEFQAINVNSEHKNLVSESISGRKQVRAIGGQRWTFSAKYNPMTRAEFMPVYAFVISQRGQLGTFSIVPPVVGSTSGDASGVVQTNGAHTAGERDIAITGLFGTLKAGDFIKFANHSKVYMLTADQTNTGDLSIEPSLIENVPNDTVVTYNNVPFTMRLTEDVQEFALSSNEYYEYELDMAEVI